MQGSSPTPSHRSDASYNQDAAGLFGDQPRLIAGGRSEYSSRVLIIPGKSVPEKPAGTRVQTEDQGFRLQITSKFGMTGSEMTVITVFYLAAIGLLIWLSNGIFNNFGWFAYFNPGILLGLAILYFARRSFFSELSRLWRGKWHDEVLCLSKTQIWFDSTSQENKPEPIELSRVKMLGIDDPNMGLTCPDEFDSWDDHLILVLLDYRCVKLLGFPVYTREEALWIAGVILQRFPQMFDPTVLPDTSGTD